MWSTSAATPLPVTGQPAAQLSTNLGVEPAQREAITRRRQKRFFPAFCGKPGAELPKTVSQDGWRKII